MTALVGLLGWPVKHSASPAMFKAAFKKTNVDAVYLPFAVPPEDVAHALVGLRAIGARGVNVTIPHKRAVYEQMDNLTQEAQLVGAVNCVSIDKTDGFMGHNTDVSGFWAGISNKIAPHMNRSTLLGAGGATRAVLSAYVCYRPDMAVTVCARDLVRAKELVQDFTPYLQIHVCLWNERHKYISESDVIVNTTSVGMWPSVAESPVDAAHLFHPGQVVQDVVYRPVMTQLLQHAEAHGATVVDGTAMLVYQGARAFEFWFSMPAPTDVMFHAVREHLKNTSRDSE